MKVYIVMCRSWNGEHDVDSVAWVMSDLNKANERVRELNATRCSSYSSEYSVEEFEVEQ